MQIAIVTGCSTGIGFATALRLAREGYRVHASVRSEASGAALKEAAGDLPLSLLVMDVDDNESVAVAIGSVIESEGRIDVLVNNAGIGGGADIESTPIEVYSSVMNTNTLGVLRCIQAVLPTMRQQRSGSIVTVTSGAGRVAAAGMSAYVASKWATEGVCESLAIEVAPFGIRVAIVEPGVVATPIFAKAQEAPVDMTSPYLAVNSRVGRWMFARLMTEPSTPDEAAAVIHEAITTDQPTLRHVVGDDAKVLLASRAQLTDEEWIAGSSTPDDTEWRANMLAWGGFEIPPL